MPMQTDGKASPLLSPRLLKLVFGQHILNGLAVSAGVGVVTAAAALTFGFTAGMACGSGAICVSIGDQPAPMAVKARTLPIGWALAISASTAAALSIDHPWIEGIVVVTFGVLAGILLGWGRWAIPFSILTMLAIVFTLGTPIAGTAAALRYEALFAMGGTGYVVVGLAVTRLLDASARRLAVGECLREFAAYLRTVANLYETTADRTTAYVRVVEQQAALADHLQTARSLVFGGRRSDVSRCLAGALVVLLDSLDALVSASADSAPRRLVEAPSTLASRIAGLSRLRAGDLERLAIDLLTGQTGLALPDRDDALAMIVAEAAAIGQHPDCEPRLARAARMTRSRFVWATRQLQRLPDVLASPDQADKVLDGVDIDAFVPPHSAALSLLTPHLHLSAPVFRHAVRLGLSLGTGYALICLVPGLSHGNWILLTIAVILRASYSVTRQRRKDRLEGTLIGCAITGCLLWIAPPPVLLGVMLLAIGTAHAFGRVHYGVTSTAASVMALLSLHFLDPVEAPPVLARLLDTVIGVSIAYLFSRILPRWEHQDVPQLVAGLLRNTATYADRCLRWETPQQAYRLARKSLIDSLAALSESAARMKGEPDRVRALWPQYGRLLAASYVTAAQIVTVRLVIRNRAKELDPKGSAALLEATRTAVAQLLDASLPVPALPPTPTPERQAAISLVRAGGESGEILVLRCHEIVEAAGTLRLLADRTWTVDMPPPE
jgi:uncharacterized membrane protein YccC